jgi:hypothetical protein
MIQATGLQLMYCRQLKSVTGFGVPQPSVPPPITFSAGVVTKLCTLSWSIFNFCFMADEGLYCENILHTWILDAAGNAYGLEAADILIAAVFGKSGNIAELGTAAKDMLWSGGGYKALYFKLFDLEFLFHKG